MIFFKWMAPEGQTLQNLVLLSTLERLIQLTAALVRLWEFGVQWKGEKVWPINSIKGFFFLHPTFLLNSPAVGLQTIKTVYWIYPTSKVRTAFSSVRFQERMTLYHPGH